MAQRLKAARPHETQSGLWRHLPVRAAHFSVTAHRKELWLTVQMKRFMDLGSSSASFDANILCRSAIFFKYEFTSANRSWQWRVSCVVWLSVQRKYVFHSRAQGEDVTASEVDDIFTEGPSLCQQINQKLLRFQTGRCKKERISGYFKTYYFVVSFIKSSSWNRLFNLMRASARCQNKTLCKMSSLLFRHNSKATVWVTTQTLHSPRMKSLLQRKMLLQNKNTFQFL